MKLGFGTAALLLLGGGSVAYLEPGLRHAALTGRGRAVFRSVGAAVLHDVLPEHPAARGAALDALLSRIDVLIAALPDHARQELSQLLALLSTAVGRRALTGLSASWEQAAAAEVQAALERMRSSTSPLRAQACQALHDIAGAAYFSDPSTWGVLGYPGPMPVPA